MLKNLKIKNTINTFILLTFLSSSHVLSAPVKAINLDIDKHQKIYTELSLTKKEYVVGHYQVSDDIQAINLLNANKELIRRFYMQGSLEGRFMFVADKEGKYFIESISSAKKVSLTINIEKTIPEAQQIQALEKQKASQNISTAISTEKPLSDLILKLTTVNNKPLYWKEITKNGTPIVEKKDDKNYILTFLYKGAKNNAKILGAPIAQHVLMERIEQTDMWYKSFIVPTGTRLSYQIAPDIPQIPGTKREQRVSILSTLQADPLNKNAMEYSIDKDKYNRKSTIILPGQEYKDWMESTTTYQGTITSYKIKSHILDNTRDIDIYKPKNFSRNKSYPVLFLFDGKEYQQRVNTPKILDNLIANKKIPPTIAVFISNPSYKTRAAELPANKDFAKFMSKELLPWVKNNINNNITPEWSILSGSSYGGLASMYTAFTYPENFTKVLSMSGSFWWKATEPEWLTKEILKSKILPLDIRLYAGKFEVGHENRGILATNRRLEDALLTKGYSVTYEEFKGSHDYFSWQVVLPDGLIHLLKDFKSE